MREFPPVPDKGADLVLASTGFADWLRSHRVAVALTTYQAGRLFFISSRADGRLRANERLIEQCQGLWTDGDSLWASGKAMLWRFADDGADAGGGRRDRRFVPREARVTGAIDIHDIAVGDVGGGRTGPIFVATAFNCLATVSDGASFRELWRPPFVSALVGEDRCHLNGLAMDGARPAYVSAVSRSDSADGWRDRRRDGGVVLDVATGEPVCTGLSMPHSPRFHDGRLWVLNSGLGELGTIDPANGRFDSIAFCPGYARGLAFVGQYAVIGLSRPRRNQTFEGLALDERLRDKDAEPRCGLIVVDLTTGRTTEWLRFQHTIDELYDVAIVAETREAEAIGLRGNDISSVVRAEAIDGSFAA